MIYLTTGGNGAGKTLFTLHDVRKQQLSENRPVYYHGFTAGEILRDWGWQTFDPKKWQDLPDGSICIFDECQNEFPAKIQGELPDYINAVAQHRRRRGFDFWMITPHPSLIHVNIRRLIESPSWHRHLKRTFGADMVSEIKFNYAEMSCEKPGAGDKGQVTMRAFPKEVYSWYQSASLHTGKRKLPKQVWMFCGAVLCAVLFGFYGYRVFRSNLGLDDAQQKQAQSAAASVSPDQAAAPVKRPLTLVEYLDQGTPRVPGMVHTAPRYDALTKPVRVPRPHSCMKFGDNPCECRSQQGTRIAMTEKTCMDVIRNGGVFADWDTKVKNNRASGYQYEDYYHAGNRPNMERDSIYDFPELKEKEPRQKKESKPAVKPKPRPMPRPVPKAPDVKQSISSDPPPGWFRKPRESKPKSNDDDVKRALAAERALWDSYTHRTPEEMERIEAERKKIAETLVRGLNDAAALAIIESVRRK